jgi:putative protein kinase ArgK-like GTPase of G3E family
MSTECCPATVMVGPDNDFTFLKFVKARTECLEYNIVIGLTGTAGNGKSMGIEWTSVTLSIHTSVTDAV